MEVKHKVTGKTQTITPEEFDVLKETGHAKNFTIISETDFVPEELNLPVADTKKGKGKTSEESPS